MAVMAVTWSCQKDSPSNEHEPEAPKDITLSQTAIDVPQAGGEWTITVTSPGRPSVSGLPDWISFSNSTFNPETYKIVYTVTVSANESYTARTASVVLSSGSLTKTLPVSQAAMVKPSVPDVDKSKIPTAPQNANATDAAKKLYTALLNQYGTKTMSGVQSSMSHINDFVDAVYKSTGAHPALAGYDFIFLQFSPTPAGWSWKQDYTDISAQKEHWNAGGVVSYMWHWNVPASEDIFRGGGTDGYGFYTPGANNGQSETDFDIREALKEGTWQNECILANIDKISITLKLLQNEGIPVVFRPLHEAAGNYTRYNPNGGAWFWWGRYGASYCKQLWALIQDRLQKHHGLNNIIWVWTVDVAPGYESAAAEWYPGDDRVDIVGVDIYENNTDAKKTQFDFVQTVCGGKKMITISECGNIPSPEKNLLAGYPWLWFMVWPATNSDGSVNISGSSLNTVDYWKSLMSNEYVYTRENMPKIQ